MLPWEDGSPNILGNVLWMSGDKNQEYLLNCNWNNNFEIPLPLFLLAHTGNVLSLVFQVVHKILVPTSKYTQWLRCCATDRKVAGSIPTGVIGIFH